MRNLLTFRHDSANEIEKALWISYPQLLAQTLIGLRYSIGRASLTAQHLMLHKCQLAPQQLTLGGGRVWHGPAKRGLGAKRLRGHDLPAIKVAACQRQIGQRRLKIAQEQRVLCIRR